jgi:hypothetical protein
MTPISQEGGDPVPDDALIPTLPATVASAHLSACAAELAGNATSGRIGPYVPDLADLTTVVGDLVAGQQQIALVLARLADHLTERGRRGGLAQVESPDLAALAEVLGAAAAATGHAASALAESRPVLDIVMTSAGPDAQL